MSGCITIYTDASLCLETKAGGWACWVKFAKFETLQASGFFKTPCLDSTDAELRAIANALSIVVKRLRPDEAVLVVVTDSQIAINMIEGKVNRPTKSSRKHARFSAWQKVVDSIHALIPDGCSLRVNKVKGHSSHDGARSYCNQVVDKAAKQAMKSGRLKLRQPQEAGKSDD